MSSTTAPRRRHPQLQDSEWLRAKYVEEGRSTREVAALVGCSSQSISEALRRHGIPARDRAEHTSTPEARARTATRLAEWNRSPENLARLAELNRAQAVPPPVEEDHGHEAPCLIWQGCRTHEGYGRARRDGRTHKAHRLAYADARGPIPEGHHVHHMCKVAGCVNPDHPQALSPEDHAALHARELETTT